MARVTVEDCILKISNRFQLVMMAAQRSRELSVGDELTVERDNDKNPVVALREIADETIELEASVTAHRFDTSTEVGTESVFGGRAWQVKVK